MWIEMNYKYESIQTISDTSSIVCATLCMLIVFLLVNVCCWLRAHRDEIQRIKAGNPDITHREAFSAAAKNVTFFRLLPQTHICTAVTTTRG